VEKWGFWRFLDRKMGFLSGKMGFLGRKMGFLEVFEVNLSEKMGFWVILGRKMRFLDDFNSKNGSIGLFLIRKKPTNPPKFQINHRNTRI
jgi:hypothetical protein